MTPREAWNWANRRFTINLLGIVMNRKTRKAERLRKKREDMFVKQMELDTEILRLARWQQEVYDRG